MTYFNFLLLSLFLLILYCPYELLISFLNNISYTNKGGIWGPMDTSATDMKCAVSNDVHCTYRVFKKLKNFVLFYIHSFVN